MLALAEYRAGLGPCKHYLPDTAAPDAEGAYIAPEPLRCHACTAIAIAAVQYQDSPHPRALLFNAERR